MEDPNKSEKLGVHDHPAKKLVQEAEKLEHEAEKFEERAEKLEERAEKLEKEVEEVEEKKHIQVILNEKYPVTVHGKKQTGLGLKEAAIKQGVPIHVDFVLSIELGGGKTELIGDAQTVKVKEGDRFLAIPNDDNS